MTSALFLVLAVLLLAWSNGANDNFKGVATLYGSGRLGYRPALALGTAATFLGSAAALVLGKGLVESFSGRGLVPPTVAADPAFLGTAGVAAAATVLIATRLGLPISTTHALVGGLVGAGLVEASAELGLARLGGMIVAPLVVSPLLASVLAGIALPALNRSARALRVGADTCVCAGEEIVMAPSLAGAASFSGTVTASVGRIEECRERYGGETASVAVGTVLDGLHVASAAAVSFARGVNDTPKMVALILGANLLAPHRAYSLIAVAIAVGGILGASRVAETMSRRITALEPAEGLVANLTTALLVLSASRFGLAVSTTHVSCGALFGIGAVTRKARWEILRQILLAWLATLPLAALMGASLALVRHQLNAG